MTAWLAAGRPIGEGNLIEFVATYGIWVVAAFIALESIGVPLPAEAALIAAGFFCAKTHSFDIWFLIAVGTAAAIAGEIVGFWIGRTFGHPLMAKHGPRFGLTDERIKIAEWLFVRYGGRFVFIARFLPVLRNSAAVLAGANAMPQRRFYFSSGTAAAAWILFYGLTAYSLGEQFTSTASPAPYVLGVVAAAIVLALPTLVLRNEKLLLARAQSEQVPAVTRSEPLRAAR
jgi:membrane protein DedA with SNARE-associated domain